MTRTNRVLAMAFVTGGIALCGLSLGVPAQTAIVPAPAFSAAELAALPTTGWFTNGGSLSNQRFSPLRQVTAENVADLQAVWRTRLGGSGMGAQYSGEAQPLVHKGTLFVVTGADDVFAIDVATGEILWRYEAHLDPGISVICCGWTSRGVALGDGQVYVGQLDGKMVALDQQTGAVRWSVQAERWQEGLSITSAPLYYEGLVVTGLAGAEYGVRGRVKAYDADDGSLVWTFYTVPGPGETGHETWPQDNDVWQHGGASVWQTPAVDPDLGLLYFSTGNPGPDFNGGVRAGDNLFATSIVALDAGTGEYRWHFQQVHHDIWDYDAPSPCGPLRYRGGRPDAARAGRAEQDRLGLHPRPRNGRATPRHRRTARVPGAAAGDLGHPTVPGGRFVRPPVDPDRSRGPPPGQPGAHLHAVLDRGGANEAWARGRRQLAAQRVRPRDGLLLRVRD